MATCFGLSYAIFRPIGHKIQIYIYIYIVFIIVFIDGLV